MMLSSLFRNRLLLIPLFLLPLSFAFAASPTDVPYTWKPVRLGAGGFVTGLVVHPLDPEVRYARTDVGNAYRWDTVAKEWFPMVVHNEKTGLPGNAAVSPSKSGVESLAVDPQDKNVVLMALPFKYSNDTKIPPIPGTVFRSTDGGRSFMPSDLQVKMLPNGDWRNKGERMAIDPINGKIAFFGSRESGLWKSVDGGLKWTQVTGPGAPAPTSHVAGIRFDKVDDKHSTVYAIVAGGPVLKSTDGGNTWTDASAGSGEAGSPGNSVVDSQGNLYVVQNKSLKVWKMTREGAWSELSLNFGSSGNQANAVAVDPVRPDLVYVIGNGGCVVRSTDGGKTWKNLGSQLQYANTLGWLPQKVKGSPKAWRSNGGIMADSTGCLWVPQGNEGVLHTMPTESDEPLQWTIDSKGIEEFVTHDVVIPPGGKDSAVIAMEDGTAFFIENPDAFTAVQANLQEQLISNGTGLAFCPNDGNFVAVVTADVHHTGSGKDYSGFSMDGGKTWTPFATRPPNAKAGSIAISRRDGWGDGQDHIVWYPLHSLPPYWSKDGGKTWTPGEGFPLNAKGAMDGLTGYWNVALKQRALVADPHVPDRFFVYLTYKGYYISEDGGAHWTAVADSGLPTAGHHAQIAPNPFVKGEFWFASGWEGATKHGLWRSADGVTYTKVDGIDRAITLTVGKGPGATGAVYFYGQMTGDPDWGIFRTTDSGETWQRVSHYPFGITDIPTCMAASQDTEGLIYVGFSGNSFVYGRPAREAAK